MSLFRLVRSTWEMCGAFTDVDQRLGGGYARLHYVNQVVLPLLQGSYNDTIGRELMAAMARLCDLCGYMSWDSGRQGLAQRYFIQALRLDQASGNRALGAHILADMTTQAHSLGDAAQALDLASAGLDCGSPLTEARCATWQGRAHALRGDQRACAQACSVAERALDRAVPADERLWFKFFTPEHMTHEMLRMASDLGRHDDVQRRRPAAGPRSAGLGIGRWHDASPRPGHDCPYQLLPTFARQLPRRHRPGLRPARPDDPLPQFAQQHPRPRTCQLCTSRVSRTR
jgi:hypothetical protein